MQILNLEDEQQGDTIWLRAIMVVARASQAGRARRDNLPAVDARTPRRAAVAATAVVAATVVAATAVVAMVAMAATAARQARAANEEPAR
jgi:hypothetical protein